MKFKWTSSNKYIIKFLFLMFLLGVFVGFYIYLKQPSTIKTGIVNEIATLEKLLRGAPQNNFLYHLVIFSVVFVVSLSIVGMPIILFYLFYEGVSAGFLLAGLFHYKKIRGILYGAIFILVNKAVIYISLCYILVVSITFANRVLHSIRKRDNRWPSYIINHIIKLTFSIFVLVLGDVFIYFFGNKILSYFLFLL